jgi:chromosome segregation protein
LYLSGIEIFGFKSFAQKTEVKFNEGITAIVGPNGCGKTNIVDAIRWCLGEQKSSMLRSDKMENVIFNGTSAKKPMGMAEVSLIIHNTKGVLPTEYTDITITRRIFRSGESEYLLNKNICRLKDITNLFMDTGIGANAYSVIELKMVETILSNKADERRVMFEEAAGVKKYKHRRRLALRKLEEVDNDLTRVNDIVSEVTKKVNSLERQAKRADRYNKLTTTLRELEIDFSERELALFHHQMKELKVSKEENQIKKSKYESDIARITDHLTKLKQELLALETTLTDKRNEISTQTEKTYNLQNAISISIERKSSLNNSIEKYTHEIEELKNQLSHTVETIKNGEEDLLAVTEEIERNGKRTDELTSKLGKFKIQLDGKRELLKSKSDEMNERLKVITNKENEMNNLVKALDEKNKAIANLSNKILELTNNVAKTVGYIEELTVEKENVSKKLHKSEETYLQKQEEKEKLEEHLNDLKTKELELKGIINGVKDKIIFLQNLVENLEGFSKGTKTLIENSDWAISETALLANVGHSASEYTFAVEAALKNNLNNILIDSLDDLKSGIEYLKKNEIGKASFYLLGSAEKNRRGLLHRLQDWKTKRNAQNLIAEIGVIGFASDFVESDTKWQPYFTNILSKVVIINTLENALELSESYPDFKFATLDGDYLDDNGVVEGGSKPRVDDSLFGRKQLLDELKNELPEKEKQLAELEEFIEDVELKISSIDLKDISEQGRMLVNDLANIEKQIGQFEFEKKKANDEIENAHSETKGMAAESNEIDNERIVVSNVLEKLVEEKQSAKIQLSDLEKEFDEFENEYNSLIEQFNNAKIQLERLQGNKRNLINIIEQSQHSTERIKKTIELRTHDVNVSKEEIVNTEKDIEQRTIELEEYNRVKVFLQKEEKEIAAKHTGLRTRVDEFDREQSELRNKRELLSEELHSSDIKLNERRMKCENLIEYIKENYSLTLEQKQFDDLDTFNFGERRNEVQEFKQRIKNLGPINLLAYSEFEEEKQREEFLLKQRDDLLESKRDIVKTIEEINITAQAKFTDTFENIRGHFVEIFRGLFNPGDEADLRLEDNVDPLEAKIEIIAKPKGKRPTSIELLSGGEKTLTAIALLFAIYLVKPSPFCILDEIDAPLDDANVDRFTKILNDFSNSTQFIVVTHNKRTMEAAQTMYGVTMQEEGISKLVGVMFNEDFDFTAQNKATV